MDPRLTLRSLVERWRRSEADAALALARGEPEDVAFPPPLAIELLGEHAAALESAEPEATAAHLARAASERAFASTRDELEELSSTRLSLGRESFTWRACLAGLFDAPGNGVGGSFGGRSSAGASAADGARGRARLDAAEAGAEDALEALRHARPAADQAAQRVLGALALGPHLDAGPPATTRHEQAARWLDATDDARDGALGFLDAHDLPSLLTRLCAHPLEGLAPAKTRYRRLGARLAPLGFDAVLDRVVRLDVPHREPWPGPKVLVREAGRDVRLLPPRLHHALLGEVLAADATGRALALALVNRAAPPALARPAASSVARTFGGLLAQQLMEPEAWVRAEVRGVHAETLSRHAAACWLLLGRLHAAGVLVRGLDDRPQVTSLLLPDASAPTIDVGERCTELAERVFGVPVPPTLARLWLWAPSSSGARFRGQLGALRVWVGLRDRYDADWYRNPRAADALRAAAELGGRGSAEAWADELGVSEADGLARAGELFRF